MAAMYFLSHVWLISHCACHDLCCRGGECFQGCAPKQMERPCSSCTTTSRQSSSTSHRKSFNCQEPYKSCCPILPAQCGLAPTDSLCADSWHRESSIAAA